MCGGDGDVRVCACVSVCVRVGVCLFACLHVWRCVGWGFHTCVSVYEDLYHYERAAFPCTVPGYCRHTQVSRHLFIIMTNDNMSRG